jgi:hypothetical protein
MPPEIANESTFSRLGETVDADAMSSFSRMAIIERRSRTAATVRSRSSSAQHTDAQVVHAAAVREVSEPITGGSMPACSSRTGAGEQRAAEQPVRHITATPA